jgi:hypothetical protein
MTNIVQFRKPELTPISVDQLTEGMRAALSIMLLGRGMESEQITQLLQSRCRANLKQIMREVIAIIRAAGGDVYEDE